MSQVEKVTKDFQRRTQTLETLRVFPLVHTNTSEVYVSKVEQPMERNCGLVKEV